MKTLKSIPNFRDFGGVPAQGGKTIKMGQLFRSEAVLNPSDDEAQILREKGIQLICDLRGGHERQSAPNDWWEGEGASHLALDILADIRNMHEIWGTLRQDPSGENGRQIMLGIYRKFPEAALHHLGVIFEHMLARDLPLLIHCTAGKDRTGFVCAMIQFALGAEEPAVFAGYLESAGRANERVVEHTTALVRRNTSGDVPAEVVQALIGVDEQYLSESLDTIQSIYGSIESYLAAAGLDGSARAALQARLLV